MTHAAQPSGFVHSARFVVLVIAKTPIPGYAKTRLCPPASGDQAAKIAASSFLDTLDTVRSTPGAQPLVALSGELDMASRGDELAAELTDLPVIGQGEGDLAVRLAHTLNRAAELFPELSVVLLGMDTPQVRADMLVDAADDMCEHDIDGVLGPASDGGWWLLGLRDPGARPALDALRETPMSMPDTGDQTLRALKGAGLNLGTAAEISDVDTVDDARAVAAEIPGSRFARAVSSVVLA